jgi:NADH-quinone oxidoreductase subunit J
MELVVFFVTAVVALIGAVAMLITRNAVHSALFLLLNFGSIAVLYLLLQAPFLFVAQLIIYAGAIVVLFLFVIMLLGAEREEDADDRIPWQRPIALVMGLLLLAETAYVFFSRANLNVVPTNTNTDFAAPVQVARSLFTEYLLPFEITSIILLVAVVGVVVLSKRMQRVESRDPARNSPDLTQLVER